MNGNVDEYSFKAHTYSYTMQTFLIYCSKDYKLRLDGLSRIKKSAEHESLYSTSNRSDLSRSISGLEYCGSAHKCTEWIIF